MKKLITLSCLLFVLCYLRAQPTINLQSFITGLTRPVMVTHAKDARLFVVQRNGVILVYDTAGVKIDTFMNIRNKITTSSGAGEERGLLSIAFSPNYASNGYFFVYYNDINGQVTISRWSVSSNPNKANMSSETIVIKIFHPFSNHNGGCLRFDQFGYLVAGTGDGGSAGDPGNRAQNIDTLLGKMLRFDVTTLPYTIPPGNLFVGAPGRDEIWSYGMRNPWRFSFDRKNNDLYIADVGQNIWEEINYQPADSVAGRNYGWKCWEGNVVYSTSCPGTTFPVQVYNHSSVECSVTGGVVYRGDKYADLNGYYFYADYCSADFWALTKNSGSWANNLALAFGSDGIVSIDEDYFGEMYTCGLSLGVVYKMKSDNCESVVYVDSAKITASNIHADCLVDTLYANYIPGVVYQWKNAGVAISGANSWKLAVPGNSGGDYTVDVINGSCTTTSASYKLDICEGVENLENHNYKFYPNPAKDIIFIENFNTNSLLSTIRIIDISGNTVLSFSGNKDKKQGFDVSKLNNGLYILQIATDNQETYQSRFVINK